MSTDVKSVVREKYGEAALKVLTTGEKSGGCCGEATLGRRFEVAPHSRQCIAFVVQTPADSGPFEQTIELTTNDPARPIVSLLFRGAVDARVEAAPVR